MTDDFVFDLDLIINVNIIPGVLPQVASLANPQSQAL
jgi:hypothetical protein